MGPRTARWVEEVKETVDGLRAIRDEVALEVAGGTAEGKAKFERLEGRLDREQVNVRMTLHGLTGEFRMLRDDLRRAARR